MMRRVLALMLCLASAWLLYGLAIELFIHWYSGSEHEPPLLYWVDCGLQVAVNVVAMVLGWHWFWRRPRPTD